LIGYFELRLRQRGDIPREQPPSIALLLVVILFGLLLARRDVENVLVGRIDVVIVDGAAFLIALPASD
jgi:hypothetical protein